MRTDTVIRPAVPVDLSAVRACAETAYAHYVLRMGRQPAPMLADYAALIEQRAVYVLSGADRILGFVVIHTAADSLFLENIAVRPEAQGAGCGLQLMRFVEDEARARGLMRIRLYTNALMHENLRWYPRLGFREIARCREQGYDRVYFEKPVAGAAVKANTA